MANLKFAKEKNNNNELFIDTKPYKILIVDDEQSIHDITNIALNSMNFSDFKIEILTAYNASQAREILAKHKDVALALIDVVMETPTSGLDLVNYIRNELNNELIRLVIRTGQANNFPAMEVIQHYDINDYKDKTELTIERLYTTVRSSIKQYEQLIRLDKKYKDTYKQMTTNQLTLLPNRMKLHEDCIEEINRTLILIDIVGFSVINDSSGYDSGNFVLKELGAFLFSMYNSDFNVYHLESDLFALVTKENFSDNIFVAVEKIKDDISKLHMVTNNFNQTIDTTIGVAYQSEKHIMRKAELALKEARSTGRNKIKYYSDDLKIIKRFNKIRQWAPLVKQGILNGDILPYYQPIYDLTTNKIDKYELLIRLKHNDEIYLPIKFLSASQDSGQMYDIFKFMFTQACIQVEKTSYKFSVNIGDSEFYNDGIVDFVKSTMDKYNIGPGFLSLEILEYNSISGEHEIKDSIAKIHELGIEIVIDDFGIECSNFGQIENLPVDVIKIDGSFIKNLPTCKNSQIIVKSIQTFADAKNIKLVAEYVCDKDVYDMVKTLNINYAQGYYLGKPTKEI